LLQDLHAAKFRQRQIKDDRIGQLRLRFAKAQPAIGDHCALMASFLETLRERSSDYGIVFNHKPFTVRSLS
jgi:hypothetical protein